MSAPPGDDDDGTIVRPPSRRPPAASPPGSSLPLGHMLPVGTRLRDYEITGLIGEGGFGIVYLAWDHSLQRRVAVKEYMPASLVSRIAGSSAIVVKSERHLDTFRAGLKSFVNEARLLARFDHPSLVKVYRFWEENGTAYMVMPYYEGPTLKAALESLGRAPTEAELRAWMRPLLDALAVMHAAHCFHRDIAPDNILLTPAGPLLLDFGAARRVIGDMTHALTVVLKPGYAPIEQYGDVATMAQGPWTDIYALACVVYYAITGKTPMSSVERLMDDAMQPLSVLAAGRYGPSFLRAIDSALALRPQDRPQNEQQFRALLDVDLPASSARMAPAQAPAWVPPDALAGTGAEGYSTLPATLTPELATQVLERPPASAVAADDPDVTVVDARPSPAEVAAPRSRAGLAIVVGGALLLAVGAALLHVDPPSGRATEPPPATGVGVARPAATTAPLAVPAEAPSTRAERGPPAMSEAPAVTAPPAALEPASPAPARPSPVEAAPPSPLEAGAREPATAAPRDPVTTAPQEARPLPRSMRAIERDAARANPPPPRTPREPAARREASPPLGAAAGAGAGAGADAAPYAPPPARSGARCSDILQKASLEPLTAEEATYLKRECR
ncbi:MAG TPA: protein kinase [Caldimonas sp.]|jgi:hypothetical protein|nr:protein kinase [Caldimonas sp.]HEX2540762.1 protein kinase [Caldimonas sp.]